MQKVKILLDIRSHKVFPRWKSIIRNRIIEIIRYLFECVIVEKVEEYLCHPFVANDNIHMFAILSVIRLIQNNLRHHYSTVKLQNDNPYN